MYTEDRIAILVTVMAVSFGAYYKWSDGIEDKNRYKNETLTVVEPGECQHFLWKTKCRVLMRSDSSWDEENYTVNDIAIKGDKFNIKCGFTRDFFHIKGKDKCTIYKI